jgi:hypothetical protein
MQEPQEQHPGPFIDFASFKNVTVTKKGKSGSVLKAGTVEAGSARKIEVEATGADEPEIILHRDGDVIEKVEVVCTCGRHTEIRLEYDGD